MMTTSRSRSSFCFATKARDEATGAVVVVPGILGATGAGEPREVVETRGQWNGVGPREQGRERKR